MEKFNDIFDGIFKDFSSFANSHNKPIGFVLGGQPGAGKSNLTELIKKDLGRDLITINADEFRKYHPDYESFQQENDKTSQDKTAEFSGAAAEYILQKAIKNRYNLVIEGTFRTSSTPIKTLTKLKEAGYEANVRVLIAPSTVSWASCQKRYETAIHFKRWTDKAHHDLVVSKITDNLEEVLKSGVADNIQIYLRDFNNDIHLAFDSSKDRFDKEKINGFLKAENQEEIKRLLNKSLNKSVSISPTGKISMSKEKADALIAKMTKPKNRNLER